jgi:hypothetical protein
MGDNRRVVGGFLAKDRQYGLTPVGYDRAFGCSMSYGEVRRGSGRSR